MSSVLNNPKYLNRLWAALNSDFECLENLYLISPGWKFEDFSRCCRQLEITLVMHATLGRGKGLDDHYDKTTSLILQAAKSFWLRSYATTSSHDDKLDAKRRIGGFFLTYLMYMKQPHKGRVKIAMGLKDLEIAVVWKEEMQTSALKEEMDFIIEDLTLREAFQFQLTVPSLGFQAEIRNYLNNSSSEIATLTREMKNIQDDMTYSGLILMAQELYVKYEAAKIDLVKKAIQINSTEVDELNSNKSEKSETLGDISDSKTYGLMSKCIGGEQWTNFMTQLGKQSDRPVLTIQNLTATEAIDRRMMMETRKRIERTRKKLLLAQKGVPKTSRPYVNEGGIFCRKKEVLEGNEKKEKRERDLCSENLWTYVNGLDFGNVADESRIKEEQIVLEEDNDEGDDDDDVVDDPDLL